MAETQSPIQIYPGRGIGWMTLGASLHAVLTKLKSQPQNYPKLDLSYSAAEPLQAPVVLTLIGNGIRLRFDGPDQRLRLIEIIDFSRSSFVYKSTELVRRSTSVTTVAPEHVAGPSFRHLYTRLLGPSYAGEYTPPQDGSSHGIYVLSYPGLAARFPLKDNSWSEKADFVSLLSSSAAGPASSIAIFQGQSWPEARSSLFTAHPLLPRSLALSNKVSENIPDEIEEVIIHDHGKVELIRHTLPPFMIVINETTPQDLVTELGPPDAIYRKPDSGISIQAGGVPSRYRQPSISPSLDARSSDNERTSSQGFVDDSENDVSSVGEANDLDAFYNYFHHGFDILVSRLCQAGSRPVSRGQGTSASSSGNFVVTKIFLHGNVPGSYSFNRHRRSRWTIDSSQHTSGARLNSEMRFADISLVLRDRWRGSYASAEEEKRSQRGMVLNRGWGESPESSIELLGGFEEGPPSGRGAGKDADGFNNLNNTELFGFPGLLFEVLKNDLVNCLTIYHAT